ncbi:MAG TPA: MmcQ/YjbR family DNA-binding protein [Candidatus Acidoferrales bacterium]|nr:MmcQ/YjbR family DNA-binding protein [Candidatus Acidoferrales bacterium]
MNIEAIRQHCLSLPHATEQIQWGADLVFKVGGKIFASVVLDDRQLGRLSFKSTPEGFAELIEREGIEPAAYVARYHWVTVVPPHSLRDEEIRSLIHAAYDLVLAGLPKKLHQELTSAPARARNTSRAARRRSPRCARH